MLFRDSISGFNFSSSKSIDFLCNNISDANKSSVKTLCLSYLFICNFNFFTFVSTSDIISYILSISDFVEISLLVDAALCLL